MKVIQKPRSKEYTSSMLDYIIQTSEPVSFTVKYGDQVILDEEYVPDANNEVHIKRLGKVCELALWGVWFAGEATTRQEVAGTFWFMIDGRTDSTSYVVYCTRMTDKPVGSPGIFSEVDRKVTRRGSFEYMTGFLINEDDLHYEVTFFFRNGASKTVQITPPYDNELYPQTIDVSIDRLEKEFQLEGVVRYIVSMQDGSMEFFVDQSCYAHAVPFRFKNCFDVPEVLSCTGQLKMSAANQSDIVSVTGIERKFGVVINDEYTISSGPVFFQSDYKLWHSLLNAQEVEVWSKGQWLPVVITKLKFERDYQPGQMSAVEFSFRLADKDKSNMLDL